VQKFTAVGDLKHCLFPRIIQQANLAIVSLYKEIQQQTRLTSHLQFL